MSVYDLKPVSLPVLKGGGLKLFAGALQNGFIRMLLGPKLLADGGIPKIREQDIPEVPTYMPFGPGGASRVEAVAAQIAEWPKAETPTSPFPSVRDYAEAYRSAQTTPEAVAEAFLAAVKDSDEDARPLRTFINIDEDDLAEQAKASADRISSGNALSILDGVPVAVKDEMDQTPYPTTVGTSFFGKNPATEDATVVARLRAAGALLVGKTNMHEIGINPTGFNMIHGTARNPYDRGHDTGGSSSGPAAAVAAGFVPLAIGADGGGSIRVPAGFCGAVGLKATFGRISEHGAAPICWSVAHIGPIGAHVEDVALAYALMAGYDPKDPTTHRQPDPTWTKWNDSSLSGMRLGVFRPWFEDATSDIVGPCKGMLKAFQMAGADIVDIEIPQLDNIRIAHAITILSEMAAAMNHSNAPFHGFSPGTRLSLTIGGQLFSSRDYVLAQKMRTRAMAIFEKVYEQCDIVLTPTSGLVAPKIREDCLETGYSDLNTTTEIMRFIIPGNFVGLPAISFPAAYSDAGLPIGMHAMSRHWEEEALLRLALAAERVVERQAPKNFWPVLTGLAGGAREKSGAA